MLPLETALAASVTLAGVFDVVHIALALLAECLITSALLNVFLRKMAHSEGGLASDGSTTSFESSLEFG